MQREDRQRRVTAFTELRVHGVGNTPPEELLESGDTVMIGGDRIAGFYRTADRQDEREAYSWGGLTSRARSRALWLLLLPFALSNAAGWMEPDLDDARVLRRHAQAARIAALGTTIVATVFAAAIFVDMVMLQCARLPACAEHHWWLGWAEWEVFAGPEGHDARRLVLGLVLPITMLVLMLVASRLASSRFERRFAASAAPHPDDGERPRLGRLPMWAQAAEVRQLGLLHVAGAICILAIVTTVALLVGAKNAGDDGLWRPALLVFTVVVLTAVTTRVLHHPTLPSWPRRLPRPGSLLALATAALALAMFDGLILDPGSGFVPDRTAGEMATWELLRIEFSNVAAISFVPVAVVVLWMFLLQLTARPDRPRSRLLNAAWWVGPGLATAYALWGVVIRPLVTSEFPLTEGSVRAPVSDWWAVVALAVAALLVAGVVFRSRQRRRTGGGGGGGFVTAAFGIIASVAVSGAGAAWLAGFLAGNDVTVNVQPPVPDPLRARELPVADAINLFWTYDLLSFGLFVLGATIAGWLLVRLVLSRRDVRGRVRELWARYEDSRRAVLGPEAAADTLDPRERDQWMAALYRREYLGARTVEKVDELLSLALGVATVYTIGLFTDAAFGGRVLVTRLFASMVPGPGGELVANNSVWTRFVDLAGFLIPFVFLGSVVLVYRTTRSDSLRRSTGKVWDVLTFWPRSYHPLAPPSYAARAIPELRTRIEKRLLAAGTDHTVVLAGHSQGSVNATAVIALLDRDAAERVSLITYGSPISSLYRPYFPRYFSLEQMALLEGIVPDRWRNLWRTTDALARPIGVPGVDTLTPDPWPRVIEPGEPPPPPLGHGRYTVDPSYPEAVAAGRVAPPS